MVCPLHQEAVFACSCCDALYSGWSFRRTLLTDSVELTGIIIASYEAEDRQTWMRLIKSSMEITLTFTRRSFSSICGQL